MCVCVLRVGYVCVCVESGVCVSIGIYKSAYMYVERGRDYIHNCRL